MTGPSTPLQLPGYSTADPALLPPVQLGYRCRPCGMTSHNRNDIKARYCGNCHTQYTGDVIVTNREDPWLPGTHPIVRFPEWGCSVAAHGAIGWCCKCPQVKMQAEIGAWRLHAARQPVPGYAGAVKFSQDVAA